MTPVTYDFQTLPGRIGWAIREVGGFATWADFARAAGVENESVVRRWVSKTAEQRGVDDNSLRLVEEHTGVPASWLRFGGAMAAPSVADRVTAPTGQNGRSTLARELAAIRAMTQDPLLAWALYEAAAAGLFAEAERERATAVAEWARSARSRSELLKQPADVARAAADALKEAERGGAQPRAG